LLGVSGFVLFALQSTSKQFNLKYPSKDCFSEDKGFMFTEYNDSSLDEILPKIYVDAKNEVKYALEH
jgi:hypothetical protein